jgi:hypothetical protein
MIEPKSRRITHKGVLQLIPKVTSGPASALEILRWPQHEDAIDPLSVNMREVSGIASQKIVGISMDRS